MVLRVSLSPFISVSLRGCSSGAQGTLLRALALYYISFLPHRSSLYAATLIASYRIDMALSACTFA